MMKQSRSRNLDTSKPLPVHRKDDLVDLEIHPGRGTQFLLTGMEKEEEEEKHLQEILTAQILGLQKHHEDLTIPTPEFHAVEDHSELYRSSFRKPGQYIHAQPFFHEDYPAYDIDEDDARFLNDEIRGRWKLHLSESAFEDVITQLELNSGSTAVSLEEAKMLLKEDDDIILLVYEYWLTKKLRLKHSLIPTVRGETVGCQLDKKNPYVAFRRRFEKMQTRKNRKVDENSYTMMLKLRRDLSRAVTLLGFVKKRERLKKAKLELTIDILDKRFEADDWDARLINEAKAVRRYRKLDEEAKVESTQSEDDLSSVVDSDYESSDEGPFAFRRKEGVRYLAPRDVCLADTAELPQQQRSERGYFGPEADRFLWTHIPGVCVSYARRRVGRGGRVVLDRFSPVYPANELSDQEDEVFGCVQPEFNSSVEFVDWDPYKVRSDETGGPLDQMETKSPSATFNSENTLCNSKDMSILMGGEHKNTWRKRYRSGGMKTINMNRVGAHNAASAVLNSHFIDLFSVGKS